MSKVEEGDTPLTREMRIVAAFCSLLVIAMASVYILLRAGFGVDWGALGLTVGLALWLVNVPLHWTERFGADRTRINWYASPAAGGLFAAAVSVLAGVRGGFLLGALLAAAGFGLLLATLAGSKRRSIKPRLSFFLTLALGAAWCAGVSWGAGFENPLFLESLAAHGLGGPVDLFFHSTLANMLSLHGVSSVGVDGLVGIQYHFGSHWIFSHWARLLGLPILDFYQVGYPIIVPALWFTALATIVFEIRRFRNSRSSIPSWGAILLVIAASVVGAMPSPMWKAGGFGIGPFFSESYAVTLALGFYLGALAIAHLTSERSVPAPASRNQVAEYLLLVLVMPLGIVSLGVLKVSTFVFVFPALAYLILRLRLYRRPAWILCLLLSSGLAFLAIPHLQPSYGLEITPFAYLRYQLPLNWWPYFLTLHFFWSWVYAIVRLREAGVTDFATFRSAVSRRSIVDLEIIAITATLGLLPGILLLLQIEAVYFTDQIRWVSLAMLLGDAWFVAELSSRLSRYRERGFFGFTPVRVVALFVGVPLLLAFLITLLSWPVGMVRMNLMTRKEISVLSGQPIVSLRDRVRSGRLLQLTDPVMLRTGLANSPGSGVIAALRSLAEMPAGERRHTGLYIPPTTHAFWRLFRSEPNCGWAMFVGPALSGLPLIDGFPPPECSAPPAYGFGLEAYKAVALLPRPSLRTDPDLCQRASRWGFNRVLVLEPSAAEKDAEWPRNFHFRQVVCGDRL